MDFNFGSTFGFPSPTGILTSAGDGFFNTPVILSSGGQDYPDPYATTNTAGNQNTSSGNSVIDLISSLGQLALSGYLLSKVPDNAIGGQIKTSPTGSIVVAQPTAKISSTTILMLVAVAVLVLVLILRR